MGWPSCRRKLTPTSEPKRSVAVYTVIDLPTVLRAGPYRFFFYSADRDEPPHVHVEREEANAKLWLEPVRIDSSRGFGRTEIGRIQRLAEEHAAFLLRSWYEYFGN